MAASSVGSEYDTPVVFYRRAEVDTDVPQQRTFWQLCAAIWDIVTVIFIAIVNFCCCQRNNNGTEMTADEQKLPVGTVDLDADLDIDSESVSSGSQSSAHLSDLGGEEDEFSVDSEGYSSEDSGLDSSLDEDPEQEVVFYARVHPPQTLRSRPKISAKVLHRDLRSSGEGGRPATEVYIGGRRLAGDSGRPIMRLEEGEGGINRFPVYLDDRDESLR